MGEPHPFDRSNPNPNGLTPQQRQDLAEEIRDLTRQMETKDGRRNVMRLLRQSGLFSSSCVQGDPHSTSYREGGRGVGVRLWARLESHCSNQIPAMLQDYYDDRNAAASSRRTGQQQQ